MEDESNKIKLNLKGVLIVIIVFTILAAIGVGYIIMQEKNKEVGKKEEDKNTVAQNEVTNEIDPVNPDVNINTDYSELDINFLKMENEKKNIIYSPLSIKYALAMLNEGAAGKTKEQIEKVIGTEKPKKYKNIEKKLSLANSAFIKEQYSKTIKEEYINKIKENYDAEVIFDEFKSAENFNKWIEEKTFGQLKNVLEDDFVTGDLTRMILMNALAIDMEWDIPFDMGETRGNDFTLEDDSKITATTMFRNSKSDDMSYYQDENVTAVSMDLKDVEDSSFEFIAIMPNKDKLSTYINNVTSKDIDTIKNSLTPASKNKDGVDLYIPKFSFNHKLKLIRDLNALGITDAFTNGADFSNMSTEDLYVSDAIHEANIDFTEEGVKAAAVTVFRMDMKSAFEPEQPKPIVININKPFMYLIVDKKTKDTWFVGSVFEPNKWDADKADYEAKD